MKIEIRPDPKRPNGGHAELSLPAGDLPETEATVSVFDAFSERYLGLDGWQSDRAEFGPYPVHHADGQARLVVGPEIVNQIEEYAAVRIRINRAEAVLDWPDDVVPLPGAARIGGLAVSRVEAAAPPDNLLGKARQGETPDDAPERPPETGPSTDPDPGDAPRTRSSLPAIAGAGVLVLLLGAGALYWLLSREGTGQAAEQPARTVTAVPDPPAAMPPAPCGAEALAGLATMAFDDGRALLTRCAGTVRPEQALAVLEQGARSDAPEALFLFGQLYDDGLNDDPVETAIGLSLSPSLPRAAEYYARASRAGHPGAAARLQDVCTSLRAASDTLSRNATEEYCPR